MQCNAISDQILIASVAYSARDGLRVAAVPLKTSFDHCLRLMITLIEPLVISIRKRQEEELTTYMPLLA